MRQLLWLGVAGMMVAGVATVARGEFVGGVPEHRQRSELRAEAGAVLDISGTVKETFRSYYAATGRHRDQATAESYDLDDFGVDAPYPGFGIHYDNQGKWLAFRLDFTYLNLSADAKAGRDYYIGLVDEVKYGGREYDNMKIPKGTDFTMDFSGGILDLVLSLTPFTLGAEGVFELTPILDIGVAGVAGQFDLDAGRARGTTVYQDPPVDFVVGGDSSGLVGIAAPMVGAGLELCIGNPEGVRWTTRGTVDVFAYDGSSKPFSSAREKDIDISFLMVGAETGLEIPLSATTDLTLGVRYQMMHLDGDIKSHEHETARIIAAHERFDKEVDFDVSMVLAFVGFRF